MGNLIAELGRRNVFRVAGVYAVVGWLLAQAASLLEASLGLPVWFDGVIVSALLLGFPVALILAWAFELTPEGVKRSADLSQSGVAPPFRKTDYAILAGVAIVIALFIAERTLPPPSAALGSSGDSAAAQASAGAKAPSPQTSAAPAAKSPASADSIAVLPFTDLSPDGDQQYFSDGVAEEILNVLARIDGLKVASRTSSFQFRSTAAGIPTIARELGVRHILEGSVRKAGSAIRITAQLIDAATDAHLWSGTFDRALATETVFAIQDEIAVAIVAALREKIGIDVGEAAPAPVPTADVDAYELYLRGRALFQARRNLDEADHLLEGAIERDPQFADALAMRAAIYQIGGEYGLTRDDMEARRIGRAFAEQALAINPENSLALAITALGHQLDKIEGQSPESYESIFAALERALELDPNNSNALNWLGLVHTHVGEMEQAAVFHRRCIELDPALSACHTNLAVDLLGIGQREEAIAVVDASIDIGAFPAGPVQLMLLAELRRRDAFLQLALNVPGLRGFRKFNALYDVMTGATEDPRIAAEIETLLTENEVSARAAYSLLTVLGNYAKPPLVTITWADVMAPYRRSPEFKEHVRASGLPDYWRAHGFPSLCRAVGENDFECQ